MYKLVNLSVFILIKTLPVFMSVKTWSVSVLVALSVSVLAALSLFILVKTWSVHYVSYIFRVHVR